MSMDLTFLSDSYTQQIVHLLRKTQYDKLQKKTDFGSVLSAKDVAAKTVSPKAKEYTAYLKEKYGDVSVKSVGKDQKSMDSLGMGTTGMGNVVIAPNILEQMADDPEKAAYYEGKIQEYFDGLPKLQAEISAMGHEIHSSGIVIHPDGTVTQYVTGDLKPEERAKIEARIRAEDKEKTNRRRMYFIQSEQAALRRSQELENYYRQKLMTGSLRSDLFGEQTVLTDRGTDWLSAYMLTWEVIYNECWKYWICGIYGIYRKLYSKTGGCRFKEQLFRGGGKVGSCRKNRESHRKCRDGI